MRPVSFIGSFLVSRLFQLTEVLPSRCIFLELFARRPVFQGQDEIHQLEVIFKVTGTPSVANWPALRNLPWYELVKPPVTIESQLREMYAKFVALTPLIVCANIPTDAMEMK